MISVEDVSRVYHRHDREVRALDGVALDVADGEFVAIQGPSGSGKSTLLLTVAGMIRPSSGRVLIDGQDLYAGSASQRRQYRASSIGFVFQTFHLIPYLDLLDNALLPQVAIRIPDARSRATALLERLGLGDRLHHRPAEVSIGERQRAALARALLKCPRLILADEPTGNLDPANAAQVLDTLSRYHVAGGTVLLVTHAPAAAAQAGRVVYLEAGRVCPGPANGAAAPAPAL